MQLMKADKAKATCDQFANEMIHVSDSISHFALIEQCTNYCDNILLQHCNKRTDFTNNFSASPSSLDWIGNRIYTGESLAHYIRAQGLLLKPLHTGESTRMQQDIFLTQS